MTLIDNNNFKSILKSEIFLNREGWKRKLAIKAYRYKFYYYHIKPSPFKLKMAKLYGLIISYVIQSNIPAEKLYIGEGLTIPHSFDNVIITSIAKIGCNVTIYHDVTIGIIDGEEYETGDIIIGDNVYIGSGAKILGKSIIGEGSKIGANALVISENIPPYSLVLSPKATVLPGKLKSSS